MSAVLASRTPSRWADFVMRQPLLLLADHLYLEKKAAANALELVHRWPEGGPAADWILPLAAIAADETVHLRTVARILKRRGGGLERGHRNPYAQGLRALVRRGRGSEELLDRLLVSALIEARSCERFGVLARRSRDAELASLYRGLHASERGHFGVFLSLARQAVPAAEVRRRWEWMRRAEAEVLAVQPPGPSLHSGVPGEK